MSVYLTVSLVVEINLENILLIHIWNELLLISNVIRYSEEDGPNIIYYHFSEDNPDCIERKSIEKIHERFVLKHDQFAKKKLVQLHTKVTVFAISKIWA